MAKNVAAAVMKEGCAGNDGVLAFFAAKRNELAVGHLPAMSVRFGTAPQYWPASMPAPPVSAKVACPVRCGAR